MENTVRGTAICLILFGLWGCATSEPRPGGKNIASAQAEDYNGPKARIAVITSDNRSSGGIISNELGIDLSNLAIAAGNNPEAYSRGVAEMLTTALFQTNRYIVLEREKLDAVLAGQDLGTTGRTRRDASTPTGQIEGAELFVMAKITGFDPAVSGGGSSIFGLFGSLAGSFKKSHVAMDVRVIDTRTSRIVAVTNVEGSANSYSTQGSFIGGTMGGNLSGFKKTPMETAIRRISSENTVSPLSLAEDGAMPGGPARESRSGWDSADEVSARPIL